MVKLQFFFLRFRYNVSFLFYSSVVCARKAGMRWSISHYCCGTCSIPWLHGRVIDIVTPVHIPFPDGGVGFRVDVRVCLRLGMGGWAGSR